MAITQLPNDLTLQSGITCAICRVRLLLSKATAGHYDANDHQTFACVSHFSEVELLIVGWADFIIRERTKYQQQKPAADLLYGRVDNVRFNT